MSLLAQIPYISPEDYLEGEAQSDIKHEYRFGQIWAMGGASANHSAISINLIAALKSHLRGKGCRVMGSDTRVEAQDHSIYYYPDLVITCVPQPPMSLYAKDPKIVVEILSRSTESRDRTTKFADYAAIPSLEEYVLVDSRTRAAWVHRKAQGWEAEVIPTEGNLSLQSIDFECSMDEIYEDVDLGESVTPP